MDIIVYKEELLENFLKGLLTEEDTKKIFSELVKKDYGTLMSMLFSLMTNDSLTYYTDLKHSAILDPVALNDLENKYKDVSVSGEISYAYIHIDVYSLLYHRTCHKYDVHSIFTAFFYDLIGGSVDEYTIGYDVDSELLDRLIDLIYMFIDIVESVIISHSVKNDIFDFYFRISLTRDKFILMFNQ
jgi:hypothetical protein